MNDEVKRRELARAHRGEVVEGSGRALKPRSLPVVISVRFDVETTDKLRQVAKAMDLPYTKLVRLAVTRFLALPDEWQPRLELVSNQTATTA